MNSKGDFSICTNEVKLLFHPVLWGGYKKICVFTLPWGVFDEEILNHFQYQKIEDYRELKISVM